MFGEEIRGVDLIKIYHIHILNSQIRMKRESKKKVLRLYFELLSRDQSRGFGKRKESKKGTNLYKDMRSSWLTECIDYLAWGNIL